MNIDPTRRRRWPLLLPDPRPPHLPRLDAIHALLARGFPYSCKLRAHTSCVNALAFSSTDGRFLASGGDDLKIHLWDLHDPRKPCVSFDGPRRNIFVLAFSAQNRFLFSGGVDDTVLKYDLATQVPLRGQQGPRVPDAWFREHTDTIRAVSPHAVQDDIFLSGSEDGRILLYDTRAHPRRAQHTLQLRGEVTDVQFHPDPGMAHLFAASDGRGKVCLRDTRMAFGTQGGGVVMDWNTRLTRRDVEGNERSVVPETSSLVWDREGKLLAVTMLHFYPTLYGLADPDPLAVCAAPPGTYANSCTMKHGSFGGPGLDADTLYAAGSDDFRTYVWDVPRVEQLRARRAAESERAPHTSRSAPELEKQRMRPVRLAPRTRLGGHRSIVNTVQVHPLRLLVATVGIESGVLLHGCVAGALGAGGGEEGEEEAEVEMRLTSGRTRVVGEPLTLSDDEEEDEGEADAIRLFDALLMAEAEADVFEAGGGRLEGDDPDEQEDGQSEEEEEEDMDVDDT